MKGWLIYYIKDYGSQVFTFKASILILIVCTTLTLTLQVISYTLSSKTDTWAINGCGRVEKISHNVMLAGMLASQFFFILYLLFYLFYTSHLKINYNVDNSIPLPPLLDILYFKATINILSMAIIFLAYFTGMALYGVWDHEFDQKKTAHMVYLNIFIITVYFFVMSDNLITLFIIYELLLTAAACLWFYTRRTKESVVGAKQIALGFWVRIQVGSVFVFGVIIYIFYVVGSVYFHDIKNYGFTKLESNILYIFLFLGFSPLIPLWSSGHWTAKVHDDAHVSLSIYLYGFLAPSAVYCFYVITNCLSVDIDKYWTSITIVLVSMLYTSLKIWGQTDIKRSVMYYITQHTNTIYLAFSWEGSDSLWGVALLCINHCFIAILAFYLVDCVERRYGTRSVKELTARWYHTPRFNAAIFFMCFVFLGVPGTTKFVGEFYLFYDLCQTIPLCLLFAIKLVDFIGFSKTWLKIVSNFKTPPYKSVEDTRTPVPDLSDFEAHMFIICTSYLLFGSMIIHDAHP